MSIHSHRCSIKTIQAPIHHKNAVSAFGLKNLMTAVASFVLTVGGAGHVFAADVLIEHRAIDVQTTDGVTHGLVEVVVRNLGSTPLTDLNLRSDSQTGQVLGNGVLHFGDIAPGAASVATGHILVDASSIDGTTLRWWLECDQCNPGNGDSAESRDFLEGGE